MKVPAGDAILVSVSLPMGGTSVPITQYVLAHDGWMWILTASAPDGDNDAAAIANTFRFV